VKVGKDTNKIIKGGREEGREPLLKFQIKIK
jgi:hypothetical protein